MAWTTWYRWWVCGCLMGLLLLPSIANGQGDYDCPEESVCKMGSSSEVCSGNGDCVCGVCECHPISPLDTKTSSGPFCQCNDYACDYSHGKLCGGEERGACKCGWCECRPDYSGNSCECPISMESCRASNGLLCNNKGECRCGVCACHLDDYYSGPTCEDCPTCAGRCSQLKACVQCTAFGTGTISNEECHHQCAIHNIYLVYHIGDVERGWKVCRVQDYDDDCLFTFAYGYNGHDSIVNVAKTKECPAPGGGATVRKQAHGFLGLCITGALLISYSWTSGL